MTPTAPNPTIKTLAGLFATTETLEGEDIPKIQQLVGCGRDEEDGRRNPSSKVCADYNN
jgi:hypothetical protein